MYMYASIPTLTLIYRCFTLKNLVQYKIQKFLLAKISFLEVPISEHEENDRFTDTVQSVPMNSVKIDNRVWRQQMLHNQFKNFQRQVYVNPAVFQLLAGRIFHYMMTNQLLLDQMVTKTESISLIYNIKRIRPKDPIRF